VNAGGEGDAVAGQTIQGFGSANSELLFEKVLQLQQTAIIGRVEKVADPLDLHEVLDDFMLVERFDNLGGAIHLDDQVCLNRNQVERFLCGERSSRQQQQAEQQGKR
jgi:hypothetical protein